MKKVFLWFLVPVCLGMIMASAVLSKPHAIIQPKKPKKVKCKVALRQCSSDLDMCVGELDACEADAGQMFPGDGYPNPDAFGVSGHGPALSYTDNGDGTFTDNNTGYMWEIKTEDSSIHDVDHTYTWSATPPAADGTLFTDFLNTLNNKCDGDETTPCTSDTDCVGIGNGLCGHAGHRDWCIPNVKLLESILDYSRLNPPTSSVPGVTAAFFYWSSTTVAGNSIGAFGVDFDGGGLAAADKRADTYARAVRPCE